MNIHKIISLAALLVAGIQLSDAQQLPVYNTYFLNPFLYNPARAGTDPDGGRINLGFQKQWDRQTNSPMSVYGTWDGRIKSGNMALGATIQHDRATNKWETTTGSLAYAYHISLTKDKAHVLAIGLQAGVNSVNLRPFLANDPLDPKALGGRSIAFDMSIGINYHWKGLNVGFSVPQVIGNKANFKSVDPALSSSVRYQRQFIGMVSYEAVIGKKKDWTLAPFVMVNFIKKSLPVYLDITLMAKYKQLVWLAVGYNNGGGLKPTGEGNGFISPNAAGIHATAGTSIKGLVDINYTYKAPVGSKGNMNFSQLGSTHEVLLSFRLKRKTDQSEFEKNKKRTDEEIAKVNQKAEDADKKGDKAIAKVDSLGEALNGRIDSVESTANNALTTANNNTKEIEKVSARLDNIVYKKFGSVYFEVDKNELTDEAKASLDAFKTKLGDMKGNYFIYLAGNASSEGSTSYNHALSAKRCDAVKRYLEGAGISQRVLLLPYGENSWVTDKQSKEEDRAQNRRVDIYLSGE
ncbi:MAG: PorP/SprF family type IX secretion system membrane protein [Sphingobacteriales bacterium]|nr:PorP/SprF family type IX secretion system membrane protein [Sphingobacteriales bacterium]